MFLLMIMVLLGLYNYTTNIGESFCEFDKDQIKILTRKINKTNEDGWYNISRISTLARSRKQSLYVRQLVQDSTKSFILDSLGRFIWLFLLR